MQRHNLIEKPIQESDPWSIFKQNSYPLSKAKVDKIIEQAKKDQSNERAKPRRADE